MANLLFNVILFLVTVNYVRSNIEVFTHKENSLVEKIDSYELSIGKKIPESGIMANIVISEPEDACKKIKEPPTDNENENLIWFVLVDISNCFSDTKFQNIKDAKYGGVIMYSTKPGRKSFQNAENKVDIPILFVSPSDGNLIKSYTYDKGFYVKINMQPEKKFVLIDNPRLIFFIGIIIGVLALVFFVGAYFYRKVAKKPEEPEKKSEN